jgi:hypothetical protein
MIPWGPFRPDVAGPSGGFAVVADSVIPQAASIPGGMGYGPFPQLITPSTAGALSGFPRGSISLVLQAGTWEVFFATATTIEQLQSDYTFAAIESGRSVTAGDDVSFCKFGSYMLNSDTNDGFKAYNVEAPAGNNAVSGAPAARFLFTCNNVVFALDCNGVNKRLQSSGVGDHTAWTSLGADGKTFEDGGALICGFDLKNGNAVLFQDSAIRVISFGNAASPALYRIDKASDGKGAISARSCVAVDGVVYLLMPDGFHSFDLQNGLVPIGAGKVDQWFLSQVPASSLPLVQASLDPKNKLVLWRYPSGSNGSATTFDKVVGYKYAGPAQEFFTATVNTTALGRIQTPGYTLDGMDAFGTLDSLSLALDDRFWQGGQPLFGALDANLKFGTFSGAPMAATLQGCESNNPVSGLIRWCTPISDAASSTIQLGVSDVLSAPLVWKAASSRVGGGRVPLRGRGLNIGFQENIPAGASWTFSSGIDNIVGTPGGPR